MRPTRSPVPATALLLLAVALALAATAAARHSYTTTTTTTRVPTPAERADEEVRRMYEAWKSKHGRGGSNDDDCDMAPGDEEGRRLRLEVFRDNLRYIDKHNAEADAGLHTFRLGLTPFADLTLDEYRGRVLGFRARARRSGARYGHRARPRGGDLLPDAIDWRQLGAVTEVKDQQQCGPCSIYTPTHRAAYPYICVRALSGESLLRLLII